MKWVTFTKKEQWLTTKAFKSLLTVLAIWVVRGRGSVDKLSGCLAICFETSTKILAPALSKNLDVPSEAAALLWHNLARRPDQTRWAIIQERNSHIVKDVGLHSPGTHFHFQGVYWAHGQKGNVNILVRYHFIGRNEAQDKLLKAGFEFWPLGVIWSIRIYPRKLLVIWHWNFATSHVNLILSFLESLIFIWHNFSPFIFKENFPQFFLQSSILML